MELRRTSFYARRHGICARSIYSRSGRCAIDITDLQKDAQIFQLGKMIGISFINEIRIFNVSLVSLNVGL